MRYVLSVEVEGKEIVRRAVYANSPTEVMGVDVFTDDEFALLVNAIEIKQPITFNIEEPV